MDSPAIVLRPAMEKRLMDFISAVTTVVVVIVVIVVCTLSI